MASGTSADDGRIEPVFSAWSGDNGAPRVPLRRDSFASSAYSARGRSAYERKHNRHSTDHQVIAGRHSHHVGSGQHGLHRHKPDTTSRGLDGHDLLNHGGSAPDRPGESEADRKHPKRNLQAHCAQSH
ncbi:unnamed protein product, partial [Closterium sp. NIES-65]